MGRAALVCECWFCGCAWGWAEQLLCARAGSAACVCVCVCVRESACRVGGLVKSDGGGWEIWRDVCVCGREKVGSGRPRGLAAPVNVPE